MELQLVNSNATLSVSEFAFGRDFNEPLIHQVVIAYLSRGRKATKALKNRSNVRGGGSKPWRQKGTGRARSGTIRSPLWRGGGVTFGGGLHNYRQKLNKKAYRAAMRSIISELVRQQRLLVVDEFSINTPKTRNLIERLNEFSFDTLLIITEHFEMNLYLAARNLSKVETTQVRGLDPVKLILFDKVLLTVTAVKQIEEWLS